MLVPLMAHVSLSLTWSSEPIARANNCAVVRTYTGHGTNELFHTAPNIPHYAKNKAVGTMKPGMVSGLSMTFQSRFLVDYKPHQCFTIEPVSTVEHGDDCDLLICTQMINLGTHWDTQHWDDSWTATTIDGKKSAQFEETLLYVTPSLAQDLHSSLDNSITETGVEVLTAGRDFVL